MGSIGGGLLLAALVLAVFGGPGVVILWGAMLVHQAGRP